MFENFFTSYKKTKDFPFFGELDFSDLSSLLELKEESSFDDLTLYRLDDPNKSEYNDFIVLDLTLLEPYLETKKEVKKQDTPSKKLSISSPLPTLTLPKMSKQDYVKTMGAYIYQALKNNGIDADKWTPIVVAQTALESAWGNEFSRKNNNFGGMKAGKNDKKSDPVKTKEWSASTGYVTINDTFRRFDTPLEFADTFVKRLKNRFKAFSGSPSDYAANIRKHGYYTAPLSEYLKGLNSIVKLCNLYLNG